MMATATEREYVRGIIGECISRGGNCDRCQIVKRRSEDRGLFLQVTREDGQSEVAKAWKTRNLRDQAAAWLGMSMGHHEWRAHRFLQRAGLPVPEARDFFTCVGDGARYHVLVAEHIEGARSGLVYLKDLLAGGHDDRVRTFEDQVLLMTQSLLDARVIDVDHQLRNIVLDGSGKAFRIDFECVRRFRGLEPPSVEFGQMIGRLLVSHVFACQPHVDRTGVFASRLAEHLGLPRTVRRRAQEQLDLELLKQREQSGVVSSLQLQW